MDHGPNGEREGVKDLAEIRPELVQMRLTLAIGEGNQHGVHWPRPRVVHLSRLFHGRGLPASLGSSVVRV
jgi:hypothetical protein